MGPSLVPQGPWWSWGIREQGMHSTIWWLERMEEKTNNGGGDGGLRFSLQFDPGKLGLDRALLNLPISALLSHLLGRSKTTAMAEGGGAGDTAAGVTVMASAFAVYLVAMYASDDRRKKPRRPLRLRSRLDVLNSDHRPRALPTPDDGLRILSSNDESFDNVIHGASVGAGDDEPDIVARVAMNPTAAAADMAGENADETERNDRSEEEETSRLKELWLSLMEREQRLQLRQAELDELRDQSAAEARERELELERRVAAAAVDARLLELKAASLQDDNRRLAAQAAELDAVGGKLARAREKLQDLRSRVQREQEASERDAAAMRERLAEMEKGAKARERAAAVEAAAMRERVEEMERKGEERERAMAEEAEAARRRVEEMEKEVEEREKAVAAEAAALRAANAALEEENMELALRLQEAEQTASTVNLVLEEDVAKEANYLRETNERLTRQIEQLHSDHCAHVEELVYLKWVNACLRHELRVYVDGEHDAAAGGDGGRVSTARDLSKSMSFRSSEKAKELMLRYGSHALDGFDPSIFSPLHESLYGDGDGDEFERRKPNAVADEQPRSPAMSAAAMTDGAGADSPSRRAAGHGGKLKFLGNIKKLLPTSKRGHGGERRRSKKSAAAAMAMPPPRDEHLEKAMEWLSSHDSVLDDDDSYESTPMTSSCERTPLSSVTTAGSTRGGGETVAAAASRVLEAETARTRSDVGASYGREAASRYHALRPDHPAAASPERRELRRRSEELRSPAAMFARGRVHQVQSNA
uniref:Uncharacterized protein n=1 Tax=Leersia perrieri TaxID=77586 RepID=A0A0D9V295_9ORYZ